MSIEIVMWVLSGIVGLVSILVATLWQMTRAEQKAQDEAIKAKADKSAVEDNDRRVEKELERIRSEHDKVINRVEGRFEKELESVENRLSDRMITMEENLLRSMTSQFNMVMELLKKDKP